MVTYISIFTVFPEKQKDLLYAIQRFYQEVVKHQPGYVSARLFTSDDHTKITAIALWSTEEYFALAKEILQKQNFSELAISNEMHSYSTYIEIPGSLHQHKH